MHEEPAGEGGEEEAPGNEPDGRPSRDSAREEARRFAEPFTRLMTALNAEGDCRELDVDTRDEIAQNIVVLVWEKYGDTCEGFDWAKLPAFAFRNFERALLKRSRRQRRFAELPDDNGDDGLVAPSKEWSDPEAGFLVKERAERIEREIARWSDAQRNPFLMQQSGMTLEAIAASLGLSVNTVRWHLANAREAILFATDGDDPPRKKRVRSHANRRNKKDGWERNKEPNNEAA